jgi:hypothetical protein
MISLHETLKLNNEAVAFFNSNEPIRAARNYYKSLCIARELMSVPPQQPHPESIRNSSTKLGCCHSSSPDGNQRDPQDTFFLYQNALIFQESSCSQTREALAVYCAGILFNTALLHHKSGLATGKAGSMGRAQQLYESSLQLLGGIDMSFYNTTTTLLIVISCTNNLAHIELEKGMFQEVSQKFKFIMSILQGSEEAQAKIFTAQELQGLLSNALMADGLVASPAA